jgi:hypothetical protein
LKLWVTIFSTKVKNLIFMLLTLVQRFLMSVSTLLPYYQTSISRHFNLREVRKSKIIQNIDFGLTKPRSGESMVVIKRPTTKSLIEATL